MIFQTIHIKNFFGFVDSGVIELADQGLVLISGENGAGKCLPHWTKVHDPELGPISIEKFVKQRRSSVLGFSDWEPKILNVTKHHSLGRKPTVILELENGEEIEVAETHPVLTNKGCVKAKDISDKHLVAEVHSTPGPNVGYLSDDEATLLGLLLGDGTITPGNLCFTCHNSDVLSLFKNAVQNVFGATIASYTSGQFVFTNSVRGESRKRLVLELGKTLRDLGVTLSSYLGSNTSRFLRGETGLSYSLLSQLEEDFGLDLWNYKRQLHSSKCVKEWLTNLGIYGTNSHSKFIPDVAFSLPRKTIGYLLAGLWMTDGYVSPPKKKGGREVSYTTASKKLVIGIRKLLLRMGIASVILEKNISNSKNTFYSINLLSQSFSTFYKLVPLVGEKRKRLKECSERAVKQKLNKAGLPVSLCNPPTGYEAKYTVSKKTFLKFNGDSVIAESPLFWWRVKKVKSSGRKVRCFDLTVDSHDHLYVFESLIGHNSSLFEALVWALWGKTTRGQTGDSVINRRVGKDCSVKVTFVDSNNISYSITRYRKHRKYKNEVDFSIKSASLAQGIIRTTQDLINETLGIDYNTFIRGPMLPQGSIKRFSQLTDAEVKAVLESALQVEVLGKAHKRAKESYQEISQQIEVIETRLQGTQDALDRALEEKERWVEQEEKWLWDQRMALHKAIKNFCNLQLSIEHAWDELVPAVDVSEVEAARDKIVALGQKMRQKVDHQDIQNDQRLEEVHALVRIASSDINRLKNEIKRIEELGEDDSVCPTCRQEISEEHLSACKVPIQSLLDHAEGDYKQAREEEDELRNISAKLNSEKHKVEEKIGQYREEAEQNVVKAYQQKSYHERKESDLQALLNESTQRREEVCTQKRLLQQGNPVTASLNGVEQEIENLSETLREFKLDLNEALDISKYYSFWVNGFSNSGLKSHILAAVTPFMNNQASMYSQDLTNGNIKINFHTQTQLKSGEWREKFFVEVINENGSETYSGNSGGEKARADLAINFTISDVVAARAKKSYPQKWFDEPFESLDEEGVEAVIELLTKMVQECGTIFVVTHQPGMQSLFSKTIRIVKENGESRIK